MLRLEAEVEALARGERKVGGRSDGIHEKAYSLVISFWEQGQPHLT